MNKRIANKRIDGFVRNLDDFENYNGTITATRAGNLYLVWHWNTHVLTYNIYTDSISTLRADYISQTTSTLIGRLVRNLPQTAVIKYLKTSTAPMYDLNRIAKMARISKGGN